MPDEYPEDEAKPSQKALEGRRRRKKLAAALPLSRAETAARVGVSVRAIKNWRNQYKIPPISHKTRGMYIWQSYYANLAAHARENGWPGDLKLTRMEVKVLNYVRDKGEVSTMTLCVVFNWSLPTARTYIQRLMNRDMIESTGTRPQGCGVYRLTTR